MHQQQTQRSHNYKVASTAIPSMLEMQWNALVKFIISIHV